LYACRGWEQWLAISIETEAHWSALREVLGDPPWMAKPDFSTAAERRSNHDVLDDELAAWARDLDVDELVDQLVARGVPAGRACDPREMSSHPQLSEWGYFERIDHPVAGELKVPTIPFRYKSFERWITSPSPLLGQHNAALLKGRLGLDDGQFEQLRADQVIGTVPARL
jgi:crotonobetainyl-CoA:carnitine CoA-transferase CaiB-like acyl-CoA transferase